MRRLICGLLLTAMVAFAQAASSITASAENCPKGHHWVSNSSVRASGQLALGAYTSSGGHCEPNRKRQGKGGSQTALQRQCALEDLAAKEAFDAGVSALRSDECLTAHSATIDVAGVVRSLIVRLRLPDANPRFGPDPNKNEWKMLAVGFPVWLWTDGPRHKEATASAYGINFRLSADLESTTFTTGDGAQVTCAAMTNYSDRVKAGSPSPTCGHVYTKPSLPIGAYTVTATPLWRIRWSAQGFSGTLTTSYSDSSLIRIGELQALNR